MKSTFRKFKTLVIVTMTAVSLSLSLAAFAPTAKAETPLGADVITSATRSNMTCVLTNTGSITANVSSTMVYNVKNTQRVQLTIVPDLALKGFIGYTASGTSNFTYLAGTQGWPLNPGTNFVSRRPALWKDYISCTITATIAASNSVTATIPVYEDTGSY